MTEPESLGLESDLEIDLATGFETQIKARLRECAPVLPPALKSRTLTRCADARNRRKQRTNLVWKLTFAGVCALQMLTLSRLDAQNAQLLAGRGAPPTFAPISLAQMRVALQERSRQLALLMSPSRVG